MSRREMIEGLVQKLNKELKKAKSPGRVDLGADIAYMDPPRIRTGNLNMDIMSFGGLPRGMMIQFWGPESSAKTTSAVQICRAVQECGAQDGSPGAIAWAAAESFNKQWARKNGVLIPYNDEELEELKEQDPELYDAVVDQQDEWPEFVVAQHTHGDGLLEQVYQLVKSNLFDFVVTDSLGAIQRFADSEEKSMEDQSYGGQAQMFSQFTKKMYSAFNTRYNPEDMTYTIGDEWIPNATCVLNINQARVVIGGWNPTGRERLKPTGGQALKHAWGLSFQFSQGQRSYVEGPGKKKIYYKQRVSAFCDKSKIGPPFREGEWDLYFEAQDNFGPGDVDNYAAVIDWGVFYGLIEKSGSWFSCEGERLGQGADNAALGLMEADEIYEGLYDQILEAARKQ